MTDYTPNRWILDEISANRKWMVEMMNGMPTECLTSCAKEIESLRSELAERTDERDSARREVLMWLGERCSRKELKEEIKKRGWEYLETEERREAMDRLAKLDEELGL